MIMLRKQQRALTTLKKDEMMRSLVGKCARIRGGFVTKLRCSLNPVNCDLVRLMASTADGKYPKHQILNLPALSPTMETGNLISWSVKEGDKVSEGDVLAEIETDKASMGFEVVDGGYVAKRLIEAGTKAIPLGTPLCVLVDSPEDVAAFKDFTPEQSSEKDVKLQVENTAPTPEPKPQETDPMVISKALIPHYYLTSIVSMEQVDSLVNSDPSISRLALIVKAAALALKKVPDVNSCWTDACIRRYNQINIKITNYDKQTGQIAHAQDKSLKDIQKELNSSADSHNATFTIRYCPNSTACAAIIDSKQAAILCIGQTNSMAVPGERGSVRMVPAVCATLSCDHRVVDGAIGASWLKEFKKILECPALISL